MLTPSANSRLKRKMLETQTQCSEEKEEPRELDSKIGKVDRVLGSPQDPNVRSGAIFILENASLKKGLVKKEWKILNSHDDANLLLKQNKSLNDYRPDIVFEALRSVIDSPLNKYGLVEAIFVKIDGGALFEIKPHVRIPRTCKRFCGLIGLSYNSKKVVHIDDYVSSLSDHMTPVFVVGAMVNGKVKEDHTHDYISVSDYPLGAKCCVGLICDALEQKWKLF
ncbi:ribosomal RNA small subunit methyltransferase NEP1 isoform X2 [Arachis ipaensis]|uniref:ribosomal RNA small subunit methyltransferase NEP1 isoform X2 n=1 Tax=Arachis ipaensis TaxID=130454 RepID=UPI000A2B3992|nr:ribosomal RNA small subunit methyltransferase NEP1 isoform X2 [Arachis ipaensis]